MHYFKMLWFFHPEVVRLFLQHEIAYKMYTSYNDIRTGKMPEFTSQTMGHPTIIRYSQLPEKVAILWRLGTKPMLKPYEHKYCLLCMHSRP